MNKKLKIEGNSVILSINPKLYPLETIYSASYVFLDRAYVFLDGDPKKEILIILKPKEKINLEELGGEFFNELINYADYNARSKETKKIREIILQKALITNDPISQDSDEFDDLIKELEDDDEFSDDADKIIAPWEDNDTTKN